MSFSIAILAAGAGDMFCGSCLRDDALASALVRAGQRVTLVPMYTPLRTEDAAEPASADAEVFYGGVNVYLQHASPIFRHTPRAVDWLLDRPGLLKIAGKFASKPPAELGALTISILKGEDGPTAKELRRLIAHLKNEVKPTIVSLPNLMFVALARAIREEVKAKVVCELTGEDLFLSQLVEPYRSQAQAIIRSQIASVDGFVATSNYYAGEMAKYLRVPRERIDVVYPGVPAEYVADTIALKPTTRRPTIGYVARICPEKGFGQLVEALKFLREMDGMSEAMITAGGYLAPANAQWAYKLIEDNPGVNYNYELDRQAKLELLDWVDVLCVPSVYAEAKGIYVLEAIARGTPVVQPAHGSFPELIGLTGGGTLAPPNDPHALAVELASLLRDRARREALGRAGHAAVRDGFTNDHMARKMLDVYQRLS